MTAPTGRAEATGAEALPLAAPGLGYIARPQGLSVKSITEQSVVQAPPSFGPFGTFGIGLQYSYCAPAASKYIYTDRSPNPTDVFASLPYRVRQRQRPLSCLYQRSFVLYIYTPTMAEIDRKAVVVGISGCSSSGKTTLARLLRDIFPNTFILHEDDFYKNDKEYVDAAPTVLRRFARWPRCNRLTRTSSIPISVDGLADWDCAGALSLPDMEQALAHIRTHGVLPVSRNPHLTCRTDHGSRRRRAGPPAATSTCASPLFPGSSTGPHLLTSTLPPPQPDLFSKEDQNSVGKCPVSDETIEAMKAKVHAWLQPGQPGHKLVAASDSDSTSGDAGTIRICIFDGFLLYSEETRATMEQIDVRLFLRVSHAKATQRREARDGYVTLEGFWQDPPGYVDKIVWPNYVEAHKWLFDDGDVEGTPNRTTLEENRILTQLDKGIDIDMTTTLEWAVDTLMRELGGKYL